MPSRKELVSRLCWMVVLSLAVSPTLVLAQLSTASLNGVIRDSSGAVVVRANVVMMNLETAVERTTATNDAGNYVFESITPGRYKLTVNAPGFSSKQISEFVLGVNQTATIDVSLAAGSESQVITVEAAAEQLQS